MKVGKYRRWECMPCGMCHSRVGLTLEIVLISNTFTLWGRVDDLSFFEYLSPFCFLSFEFHCTFSFIIKYYHILFIFIVFWLGCDMPSGLFLFLPTLLLSIFTPLLTIFVCFFVLFRSCCSHARVFGKTLVHEFPISYSHTEWYLPFFARRNSLSAEASSIKIKSN